VPKRHKAINTAKIVLKLKPKYSVLEKFMLSCTAKVRKLPLKKPIKPLKKNPLI
jgi:hypothetical protein